VFALYCGATGLERFVSCEEDGLPGGFGKSFKQMMVLLRFLSRICLAVAGRQDEAGMHSRLGSM
jgi:hypothetical protein